MKRSSLWQSAGFGVFVLSISFVPAMADEARGRDSVPAGAYMDKLAGVSGTMHTEPEVVLQDAEPLAGMLFGQPVPMSNYYFAKRVVYTYPRPWGGADLATDTLKEALVWEMLILHFEAFRRGIEVPEEDKWKLINSVLQSQEQTFDPIADPQAYEDWLREQLSSSVELFENQIEFMLQVRMLKDQVREELPVEFTEEELVQKFLNERNHVSGEMVVFESREEAQAFYEAHKSKRRWNQMKKKGEYDIRPVSMMTLEAYIDLWGIPEEQMYAFHSMKPESVGEPMPFGKQWCVYLLLDKRTADLDEFPPKREYYEQQVGARKKYRALIDWIERFKEAASLEIYIEESG